MTTPDVGQAPSAGSGGDGATGIPATLFTQEQVNHFNAQAKRGALESFFKEELGLDKPLSSDELKASLAAAAEYQKLQNGQKSDVERLTTDLAAKTAEAEQVPGLQAAKRRAELAGDAGLKSRYHKYVEGETDEEIDASIKLVLADVGGGGEGGEGGDGDSPPDPPEQRRQGTGGLTPNPQQGSGGGGGTPKATMSAGRDAYKAKRGETKE